MPASNHLDPTSYDQDTEIMEPTGRGSHRSSRRHRRRRRRRLVITLVVALLVVLGGAAVAAVRIFLPSSVNPASRLPESVLAYSEINLDPSLDQTPKLLRLLKKFDDLNGLGDADGMVDDLLSEIDIQDVNARQLTNWVGTRGAAAFWIEKEETYLVLALASKDDEVARSALADISGDVSDPDLGYVVEDGLATLVLGDKGAQKQADLVVEEGHAAPLSESARFRTETEWLDDEQLFLTWVNVKELMDEIEDAIPADSVPEGFDMDAFLDAYTSSTYVTVGVRATDDGFDVRYKADGEADGMPVRADWRKALGAQRQWQVAAVGTIPDLKEQADNLTEAIEGVSTEPDLERLDEFERGQWDYDSAADDDELSEWNTLVAQYQAGEISEDSDEYDRLLQLDTQIFNHGIRSVFDDWKAEHDGTEKQWRASLALTPDEYLEFLKLNDQAVDGTLPDDKYERHYELALRFTQHGLVTDYALDPVAMINGLYNIVSFAQVDLALDNLNGKPKYAIKAEFSHGAAKEVEDVPGFEDLPQKLRNQLDLEGNTLRAGETSEIKRRLADHDDFEAAFADAPKRASWAAFVDVAKLVDDAPKKYKDLNPIKTVSWVQGTDGSGLIRIIIR